MFLRSIHNSLHSGFVLVFCLSFFFKGRHFVMLHKIFSEKQEELTLYLPGPTLSGSFVCCYCMHYLFRKISCNILIQKFQNCSSQTACLALTMSLFQKNYWCKNYWVFFAACDKHPLSGSFLDRRIILWDWTCHIIKIFRMQCKILPKTLHTIQ